MYRSSISGSKSVALTYSKVLAGSCVLLLMGLEILSWQMAGRFSSSYARVTKQVSEAVQARPGGPGEPVSVLMVGNSFLLYGVDVDQLREHTGSTIRVYPIFLEATGYYDWLYGLRRLFRQGARPQVVVVGLEVNTFLANSVRDEYAPMMLFDAVDVLDAASKLHLDRTATSNLLLAHWSTFWDMRTVYRKQLYSRIIPNYQRLFPFMLNKTDPNGPEVEAATVARLQTLRELCEANGAKLMLLIPPTLHSEDAVSQMASAARKAGVEPLVPVEPKDLSANSFESDTIHLNPSGAARFTTALGTNLCEALIKPCPDLHP